MKRISIFLLLTNILFATTLKPIEENLTNEIFLKKIDETFTFSYVPIMISSYNLSTGENQFSVPKRENYPLWLDVRTLDNVEHNSSQKILKEKMDELVGYYLKTDNLFSYLRYDDFFQRLYGYLTYLEKYSDKKENREMLSALLNKTLKDSKVLIKNSDNFLNYIISLNMRKKLYASFNNLENHKDIFLKYLFPKSKLFFEKLELDKQNTLKMWEETEEQSFEEVSLSKETMKKIQEEVTLKFKPILDNIYKKAKIAILDGSAKNIKAYDDYFSSVQKVDNPKWEKIKYTSSLYKVKLFEMLGIENNNFGNIPNVMVKVLPRMIVLPFAPYQKAYEDHKALEEIEKEFYK